VSEAIYLVVIPLLLLLAAQVLDEPSWPRWLALGAVVGLAALTRSEGILFLPFLVVPVVLVAVRTWKARLLAVVLAGGATLLVLTPWLVRNYDEFDGLTLSTNRGVTLAGGWCPTTFHQYPGSWDLYCVIPAYDDVLASPPPDGDRSWNELTIDQELTRRTLTFAKNRIDEVPKIMFLRVARTFGVYDLGNQLQFDQYDGRDRTSQQLGIYLNFLLLPLAVVGAFVVGRRYLAVLLAGPAVTIVTAATFYGSTRMRVPAEPTIAVLAALASVAIVRWIVERTGSTPSTDATGEGGNGGPPTRPTDALANG